MMKVMFSLIQKIFQTNSFHKYSPGQIQILSLSISLITVGLELSRSEHVYIPDSLHRLTKRILHLEKPHLKNSKRLQNDQVPFLRQVLLLLHLKVRIAFCFAFCFVASIIQVNISIANRPPRYVSINLHPSTTS